VIGQGKKDERVWGREHFREQMISERLFTFRVRGSGMIPYQDTVRTGYCVLYDIDKARARWLGLSSHYLVFLKLYYCTVVYVTTMITLHLYYICMKQYPGTVSYDMI
jgi:hypothetical protein